MRHNGVTSVSEKADVLLGDVGIRLVNPQTPGLDLLSNGEMSKDLAVELGIRLEEILSREILRSPGLCSVVTLVAGEEAVV
jgi:hypothetical protein